MDQGIIMSTSGAMGHQQQSSASYMNDSRYGLVNSVSGIQKPDGFITNQVGMTNNTGISQPQQRSTSSVPQALTHTTGGSIMTSSAAAASAGGYQQHQVHQQHTMQQQQPQISQYNQQQQNIIPNHLDYNTSSSEDRDLNNIIDLIDGK